MEKTIHCLIVDDDHDDQDIFEMCLEKVSDRIHCKKMDSGIDALSMLAVNQDYTPDYIFLDVNMPRMNGIECLKNLKAIERVGSSHIYMYSTVIENSMLLKSKELGADDFLIKPSRTADLTELLAKIFDIPGEEYAKDATAISTQPAIENGEVNSSGNEEQRAGLYALAIEEMEDCALILLSEDGTVRTWNAGAAQMTGYTAAEAQGRPLISFFTQEDTENAEAAGMLQEAKKNRRATAETWFVKMDGQRFWARIVVKALHGAPETAYSATIRDLTTQKLAEDRLFAYAAELELQNSELEQFAYVASHDLQEPIRKIRTFSGLIQDNYGDEDFAKKYFEKLDQSAERMAELVKSLLSYSRLARETPHVEDVNLNSLVNDVKLESELLMRQKNAKVISRGLPTVHGSYSQLAQLFSNILGNSLKFSATSPVIQITSSIVRSEDVHNAPNLLPERNYYEIMFEDNGIGFDDQFSKVIFSLYKKLHSKTEYPGAGIGLALCKKIAENHEGLITASSEVNKGSRFYFYLPADA